MLKRFDYKCTKCSHIEEKWVDGSKPSAACTQCGGESKRIISPISTKFEGFGWPDADDKWARDHERAANK